MRYIANKRAFFIALALGIAHNINATNINVDVDIKTSTQYHDCTGYVGSIVELVKLYIKADADKGALAEQISFLKKKLKDCERNNKRRKQDYTIRAGVGHSFKD